MTNGQVVAAAFVLIGFFAVLAGTVVLAALLLNDWAYRWERRHKTRAREVVDRCNVYTLRPADVVPLRKGDDAA